MNGCDAHGCTGPLVGTWKITDPQGRTSEVRLCARHAEPVARVTEWAHRARTRQSLTERLDDLWIKEN